MISHELLEILCCPETHQKVAPADSIVMTRLNDRIAKGELRNRAGHTIDQPLDGGLVRTDGRFLYPIRQGLPIMLIDEAIPLEG